MDYQQLARHLGRVTTSATMRECRRPVPEGGLMGMTKKGGALHSSALRLVPGMHTPACNPGRQPRLE